MLKDQIDVEVLRDELLNIQKTLFTIGSHLAADPSKSNLWLPELTPSLIELLEQSIDEMQMGLPELKAFILPGGHPTVSQCHIARCVCRRAERYSVMLNENEKINEVIIQFLNRLSDYLFVMARHLGHLNNCEEVVWNAR